MCSGQAAGREQDAAHGAGSVQRQHTWSKRTNFQTPCSQCRTDTESSTLRQFCRFPAWGLTADQWCSRAIPGAAALSLAQLGRLAVPTWRPWYVNVYHENRSACPHRPVFEFDAAPAPPFGLLSAESCPSFPCSLLHLLVLVNRTAL